VPAGEFSISHIVQFSETDMAGVVHFSNYFRWMEMVEHAFFRSLGLSVVMTHEAIEIGWPRVACSCEFFGPARFEDKLTFQLRVTKVGGKSLTYEADFLKGQSLLARGTLTSVCVTLQAAGTFKAIAIPQALREKLQQQQGH
jgi:YbgC/YbaW family acyl-CoA thioester hydrolase